MKICSGKFACNINLDVISYKYTENIIENVRYILQICEATFTGITPVRVPLKRNLIFDKYSTRS